MAAPKKFFHDHWVLLLLSINTFLVLVVVVLIPLSLGNSSSVSYITQYRPNVAEVNDFKVGGVIELFSFIGFSIVVLVTHLILSMRAYRVRRHFALAILSLGILLQVLTIIISNALLSLR